MYVSSYTGDIPNNELSILSLNCRVDGICRRDFRLRSLTDDTGIVWAQDETYDLVSPMESLYLLTYLLAALTHLTWVLE